MEIFAQLESLFNLVTSLCEILVVVFTTCDSDCLNWLLYNNSFIIRQNMTQVIFFFMSSSLGAVDCFFNCVLNVLQSHFIL